MRDVPAASSHMARTTLITCSVYPDLTRLWYWFASRNTDPARVDILILDCGAGLRHDRFPRARIRRYPNVEHGMKLDAAARMTATEFVFFMDDDAFPLSPDLEPWGASSLATEPSAFACTFLPSDTWTMRVGDAEYRAMGSYAVMIRRDAIVASGLSLASRGTVDTSVNNAAGYWDTTEWFQHEMLREGGRLIYAPDEHKERLPTFFAASTAYVSLARTRSILARVMAGGIRRRALENFSSSKQRLHRTITLSGVIEAYRRVFREEPQFSAWPDLEELVVKIGEMPASDLKDFGALWAARARTIVNTLAIRSELPGDSCGANDTVAGATRNGQRPVAVMPGLGDMPGRSLAESMGKDDPKREDGR